jgi:hypothetical protein
MNRTKVHDALTFPSSPNLASPPQWLSTATNFPLKRLRLPRQNVIRRLLLEHKSPALGKQMLPQLQSAHPELETKRLFEINPQNAPADVTTEILTIQTGGGEEVRRNKASFDFIITNKLWYTQGLAAAFTASKTITFPVDAIEINALPNWLWATWEWTCNPGRCDFTGSKVSFGVTWPKLPRRPHWVVNTRPER